MWKPYISSISDLLDTMVNEELQLNENKALLPTVTTYVYKTRKSCCQYDSNRRSATCGHLIKLIKLFPGHGYFKFFMMDILDRYQLESDVGGILDCYSKVSRAVYTANLTRSHFIGIYMNIWTKLCGMIKYVQWTRDFICIGTSLTCYMSFSQVYKWPLRKLIFGQMVK